MQLRKTFLWSMIVSLSLAALLGIAALLLPGFRRWSEEILVSSLLVGGFSLGCLICAIVLGKRRLVPAMWVGIVAALCALAVWLILIWWPAIIGPGQWVQGQWVQQWSPLRRLLEKLGVQFTTVMGWALFIGLLVLPQMHGRAARGARALAVVLATLLALFTSSVAWFQFDDWWVFKLFATFAILFGWNLWGAVLLQVRLDRVWYVRVRLITICIGAALVSWSLALLWDFIDPFYHGWRDWWERMTGVLAILASCGTVVTPILALIEKLQRKSAVESLPMKVWVTLTCPRCKTQQQMRTGPDKCANCGLRITIEVEESRCTCGYQLYRLESERCPECGREVPEADRWAADATDEIARQGDESPDQTLR